jgi:hypothetical protein
MGEGRSGRFHDYVSGYLYIATIGTLTALGRGVPFFVVQRLWFGVLGR